MKKIIIASVALFVFASTAYASSGFKDVKSGAWYEKAVQFVVSKGYMKGDGEYFRPNDTVKRAEMAQILLKLSEQIDMQTVEISRLSSDVVNNQKLMNASKYWEDKTWNAVGDSITENGFYTMFVEASLGLKTHNFGLAASTVAVNDSHFTGKSIYERVLVYPDADIWTVFGGANDWILKTPVGTIGDNDTKTFYGSLKAICDNVLSRPNKPKLILFTPLQSNRNGANDVGVTMSEYRQAIIDVGKLYSVPVLDLYNTGGIDSANLDKYTEDGVHPNILGTELYAPKIVSAIQNLN